jgi:hypothetical protein
MGALVQALHARGIFVRQHRASKRKDVSARYKMISAAAMARIEANAHI